MDISIPDRVVFFFYTAEWVEKDYREYHYCFRHAVERAVKGEKIQTKLLDYSYLDGCADCKSV